MSALPVPEPGQELLFGSVDELTIAMAGELDLMTTALLLDRVNYGLRQRPRRLILDLSAVDFLGSTGISALLDIRDRAHRTGASLMLRGAYRRVIDQPLRVTGVLDLFIIELPCSRTSYRCSSDPAD
jgi:anti-sigma B factor antagonist